MDQDADETALDPALPIVDAHHHLWTNNQALSRYALDFMPQDLMAAAKGHNVVATVYLECHQRYRSDGPEALRPVGETAFAAAAGGRIGGADVCAGVVGHADLMLGEAIGAVLEAHIEAGQGRFRGVRNMLTSSAGLRLPATYDMAPPHRLLEPATRAAGRELARRGLTFDTWLFHPQLADLSAFADALPELTIVLNHIGGYVAAGDPAEAFAVWRGALAEVARRPNVVLKIGGMGMEMISPAFAAAREKPSSEAMAAAWRPLFETCVALFGAERCMLESNFPVDSPSGSYRRFWNAFKRLAAGASASEKAALFSDTARRVYRLESAA